MLAEFPHFIYFFHQKPDMSIDKFNKYSILQ